MTAKIENRPKGRTRAARCSVPRCGGALVRGHGSTRTHLEALRLGRVNLGGPAHEKRIFHIASREREDDYYARLAEQERAEAIEWLIATGPLPDEPTVTYDGSMAQHGKRRAGSASPTSRCDPPSVADG
jgi:hypothetical protein